MSLDQLVTEGSLFYADLWYFKSLKWPHKWELSQVLNTYRDAVSFVLFMAVVKQRRGPEIKSRDKVTQWTFDLIKYLFYYNLIKYKI